MDIQKLQEPIPINEVDFRVQSVNTERGFAVLVPYKNARVDMNRLNSVVGPGRWQRKHEIINGLNYCSVGIWNDEIKEWAWVQDVGTEPNNEKGAASDAFKRAKEKGAASDAFKRACFNLGIGIELYDYPNIFVNLNDAEKKNPKQLTPQYWRWSARFDGHRIIALGARDKNANVRFNWGTWEEKQ